ncbi:hypothetical protein TNCV_2176121 [Trichonephila clavipes]|uniref:Uncharacterized protein n=1 Tax=Trichonephila clavipes TaxID=2585209 RepID=A0A8X6SAJ4_TRICX|nr:hypothetical protein TNCV_2176121 [Trichonephila clavipes]
MLHISPARWTKLMPLPSTVSRRWCRRRCPRSPTHWNMSLGRQGQVRACIVYPEPNTKRVFVLFCKDNWYQKKTLVDNFKRAIMGTKNVNEFRPDDVLWEKISKGLLRNPDRPLKNSDKRMVYIYNNMFFVKKDFTLASKR